MSKETIRPEANPDDWQWADEVHLGDVLCIRHFGDNHIGSVIDVRENSVVILEEEDIEHEFMVEGPWLRSPWRSIEERPKKRAMYLARARSGWIGYALWSDGEWLVDSGPGGYMPPLSELLLWREMPSVPQASLPR